MDTFADQIKKHRKRLGMSQSQLAEALEVHALTISAWEMGRQVPSMKAAVLMMLTQLKPLPKGKRRQGKMGRPKSKGD